MRKLFIYTIILIVIFSAHSCNAQNEMEQIKLANTFVSNSSNYQMDIQSAGVATIPVVTLSDENELYIEYAYQSENEDRKGQMRLLLNSKTVRFEGSWKTIADSGNMYQGDLYFIFAKDGLANGFYQFNGANYKITIFKK